MTPEVALELVTDHVKTGWNAATFSLPVPGSATPSAEVPPIGFGNEGFTPPAGALAYVHCFVIEAGKSKQLTMGGPGDVDVKRPMKVVMSLCVPQNTGDAAIAQMTRISRSILEGVRLADLNAFEPTNTTRNLVQPPWRVTVIEFPFSYNETK